MKEVSETIKVGKRGTFTIPAKLRKRLDMEKGGLVILEARDDGILIRKAVAMPIENYTPERKAEFILSNAVNSADYENARKEVKKMGLDPDSIPHQKPT